MVEQTIFQCPVTGRPLLRQGDRYLIDGETECYRIRDGIALLVPDAKELSTSPNIIDWYDTFGWVSDTDGKCKETHAISGSKRVQALHTSRCIARLGKYFDRGGRYLLDVGCGAIPHEELLAYGRHFDKRVCVDLSVTGLQQARKKLGDRGIYVRGDATNLPLAKESVDAITCNHLIYQLPASVQASAILELWRVLKPGGVAVIVYRWRHSGLSTKLEQLARALRLGRVEAPEASQNPERDADDPHLRQWFEDQNWPFSYAYDCYRVIDQEFMRTYVSDDWRGALFLNSLLLLQRALPWWCGRYGLFPALVIRKPSCERQARQEVDQIPIAHRR